MKRLFQIRKPNGVVYTEEQGNPVYFDSKPAAKAERNALNDSHPRGGYTVSPGPDHHKFNVKE